MARERSVEEAYGKRRAQSWSRIDMLLALYESGISRLTLAISATENGETVAANQHRLKAMGIVQGIAAGLEMNDSEIVKSIARLCEFISHAIREGTVAKLESAKTVLSTLRDGFTSIREEAVALEEGGTIPRIDSNSAFNFTV